MIIAQDFPQIQNTQVLEFFGPPLNIAYKDNTPTPAALGFFKNVESRKRSYNDNKRG